MTVATGLVAVVGLLAALAAPGAGQVADDPVPPESPLEDAPPGFTDDLVLLYSSARTAAANLYAALPDGGSLDDLASVDEFRDDVGRLTDEQVDMIYTATEGVGGWAQILVTFRDLAEDTAGFAAGQESVSSSIPPPPDQPEPAAPVEPIDPASCPPSLGTNVGHDAIYAVDVALTSLTGVVDIIPNPLLIPGHLTSQDNPAANIISAVWGVTDILSKLLTFLKDRHLYCETNNQYDRNFNTDAILVEVYTMLDVAYGTIGTLEDAVDLVQEQLAALESTTDDLLTVDIQDALLKPVGSPPNAAYELPAANGGYLDAEPVGVRSVVTRALTAAQTAGLPVNAAAVTFCQQAGAALAEGDYVVAFELYQRCYQSMVGVEG